MCAYTCVYINGHIRLDLFINLTPPVVGVTYVVEF